MRKKRIVLTVTSEPNYDQRMIRICTSLHNAGYDVTLIGRRKPTTKPIKPKPFRQVIIYQRINQGKLFYALYNLKMFFYLLFRPIDAICAIDLDTILPVYFVSRLRGIKRVYDAHELFCEMEEVVANPTSYKMWKWIERFTVPHFKFGYTVNQSIADEFKLLYNVDYGVVRSATVLKAFTIPLKNEKYILYQGAVNKGRCFDKLIPAMKDVNARLIICGEGNFYLEAQQMVKDLDLQDKVIFKGYVPPEELTNYTANAYIGITLFVATSKSNELSLANRFFDYMHHGVPQLAMAYPEYENINREFEIASLISNVEPTNIAKALNHLLEDEVYYTRLQQNCLRAREVYCWQEEEKKLLGTYKNVFAK